MVMRGTCEDDRYHIHVFECLFSLKLEVCMQRLALLIHGVLCVSNTKTMYPCLNAQTSNILVACTRSDAARSRIGYKEYLHPT